MIQYFQLLLKQTASLTGLMITTKASDFYYLVLTLLRNRQIPTQLVSIENLHRAASTGDVQMLAIISNRDDALLRARDENGYQAIHIATINRQPEVIEYIAKNYTQYLTSKTPVSK